MKDNRYIKIFYILFILTCIVSAYISYIIGTALQTLLLFYELFYIVTVYKSKNRKYISLFLVLLIILLFLDAYIIKDAGTLINIFNLIITPIFIFSYYGDNDIKKFRALELLKITAIILPFIYFLKSKYFFVLPITVLYPYLFLDRGFNNKRCILTLLIGLILSFSDDFLLVISMFSVNVILFIYNLIRKDKKNILLLLALIIMNVVAFFYPNMIIIYGFNSDVFFGERMLIKLAKTALAVLPLCIYSLITFKHLLDNKFKINHEMFITVLSLLVFVFITIYVRFDYSVLVVLVASLSLFVFYKYIGTFNKKKEDKILVFTDNLSFNDSSNNAVVLSKIYKNLEVVSTYKSDKEWIKLDNVDYIIKKDSNIYLFKKAMADRAFRSIIKESFKRACNLIDEKSGKIDRLIESDSKYVITDNYVDNGYVTNYTDKDTVKIAIEHRYNEDEKYIGLVRHSIDKSTNLVVTIEEAKDLYKNKKSLFIPNVLYKSTKKSSKTSHNIVSIGRLTKNNNYEFLIDIIKELKKSYEDIKLTIIGVGEEKKNLDEKIKESKLSKNIHLVGNLNEELLDKVLLDSSIYVSVSDNLSSDISMIYAEDYGIPVVALDTNNNVKYLLKKSGILINNKDKKKIVEEISKLFDDNKEYSKYSKLSKENAKNYSIDKVDKLWKSIIK